MVAVAHRGPRPGHHPGRAGLGADHHAARVGRARGTGVLAQAGAPTHPLVSGPHDHRRSTPRDLALPQTQARSDAGTDYVLAHSLGTRAVMVNLLPSLPGHHGLARWPR